MKKPRGQLTVRRLGLWAAAIAVSCALPAQLSQIINVEPARKSALENDMRATQRLDYMVSDARNFRIHRAWYDYYEQEAKRMRGEIGWKRLTLLALVGFEVMFLAWQLRLRWVAPPLALSVVGAATALAEAELRLPWEAKLGLASWAFGLLLVSAAILLAVAAGWAALMFAIWRRSR